MAVVDEAVPARLDTAQAECRGAAQGRAHLGSREQDFNRPARGLRVGARDEFQLHLAALVWDSGGPGGHAVRQALHAEGELLLEALVAREGDFDLVRLPILQEEGVRRDRRREVRRLRDMLDSIDVVPAALAIHVGDGHDERAVRWRVPAELRVGAIAALLLDEGNSVGVLHAQPCRERRVQRGGNGMGSCIR